ncbi:FG-GAP-like repeat-containing protein [Streptomyces filamentosus]|uniref:FG-GAP-like repeat-containing protein n=1 Tax=Streptomyces filamentosus TaxID=67294 RepID=UPI003828988E
MSRTAPARRTRARVALLAAVLVATSASLAAPAAAADPVVTVDRIDIAPDWRAVPRAEVVTSVSANGYAHATEDAVDHNYDPLVWTDFATGRSIELGTASSLFGAAGIGGRYVPVGLDRSTTGTVRNLATGAEKPFTVPSDAQYVALFGDRLVLRDVTGYSLVSAADPAAPATRVTGWPADADLGSTELVAGDSGHVVVRFGRVGDLSGDEGLALLDLATARLSVIEGAAVTNSGSSSAPVVLTADRLAWVDRGRTVHLRDRTGAVADRTFPLPETLEDRYRIGVVGDWVVVSGKTEGADPVLRRAVVALHPDGRSVTLLEKSEGELNQVAGDGGSRDGVAVVGGAGATDWSLLKVVLDKAGTPFLEKLAPPVAPVAVTTESLALGSGRLSALETGGTKGTGFSARTLPVGPLHTGQSAPVRLPSEPMLLERTTPLFDSGDGRTVHLARADYYKPLEVVSRTSDGKLTRISTGKTQGAVADVFGRWVAFRTGSRTLVLDLDAAPGKPVIVQDRESTAAAVWGDTLFSATSVAGEVSRTDLATGKDLGKLTTRIPCAAEEYQLAAGRWLYWKCASSFTHGVVDLRKPTAAVIDLTGKAATRGLLGDGYYADRDSTPGTFTLHVTDFHTGTPTRFVPGPAAYVTGPRREGFAVDRFGGPVAYLGIDGLVHAVWPGVPTSDLTAPSSSAPASLRLPAAWKAYWTLSKPASYHEVTIREQYSGKTVRTFRANETRGRIDVTWDGRTAAGKTVPNGPYEWELRAGTADGKGQDLRASGRIAVTGGQPAWRDLAGNDAQADLLATDAAGAVSMYRGTGYDSHLSARIPGSGAAFPAGTVLVPFGDVNGDGCADVLARVGGELRAYRPGCGKVVTASSPYTAVGSGWGQYDVLTSSGDVNGDGHADLIARQTTTGDVYFYGGTATHRLTSRVRIGTNWKLYKKLTGAGDLNRDGRGDLLGIDSAGVLWRYYGTATGGVTARVRIGGGWQGYTAVLGTGDLSGDGIADLLARDTTGRLYAYTGRGNGLYADRVVIGQGGWNTYRSLS